MKYYDMDLPKETYDFFIELMEKEEHENNLITLAIISNSIRMMSEGYGD